MRVEPESSPELAAMNMVDQIMDWLEAVEIESRTGKEYVKVEGGITHTRDAQVKARVADWVKSKYG